ncbi:hypothetical protein CQW23_30564 [Capsicum baccatum]|uniref:Uncharacterized protein n=1 Tax=Capsicum baccatum TaxID=33114 RepID=A0A2G2VA50_CAPBA|nr:hypothetical protein CQW23_30564 [Capsicum baccatum]
MISPAFYITLEPAPTLKTFSGSLSPSPYLVNHKRRGGGEAFANRKFERLEEVEQVDEKTNMNLNLEKKRAEEN